MNEIVEKDPLLTIIEKFCAHNYMVEVDILFHSKEDTSKRRLSLKIEQVEEKP